MVPRNARPHRRTAAALAGLAAVTVAIPLLTGCGAVQKAMDCANTATAVVDSVDKLQRATRNVDNPQEAQQALDDIDRNLDKVKATADDPELTRAIGNMNDGVKDARTALDNNKAPDVTPIVDAAGELTSICTPG
ncbi:hypothetical protein [Streptomyces sp. NPDC048248]|uniref:hypothetical protein n=1 Tax=Streptomyces sp. NPDC048248 TaxID=3365523 RepID=UPI003710C62E